MQSTSELTIEAVADATEWPTIVAASEQLSECLTAASNRNCAVRAHLRDSAAAVDISAPCTIIIYSLLPAVLHEQETLAEAGVRVRSDVSALAAGRSSVVLVSTVFRFLAADRDAASQSRLERVRRLNLLAAYLSHDLGAGIIDIDRTFAHIGARELKTDYRLGGRTAAEVAGYVIVSVILAMALNGVVAPEILERARHFQGSLVEIGRLLNRRMKAHLESAGSHAGR